MAVVFELVVNFGTNESAVSRAEEVCRTHQALRFKDAQLGLRGPWITRFTNAYIEFSVGVEGLNMGGPRHPAVDAYHVEKADLRLVSEQLYELLQLFDGYLVAQVGWDPEGDVNPEELREQVAESGTTGFNGIVLAEQLARNLGLDTSMEPFTPGHLWFPSALHMK